MTIDWMIKAIRDMRSMTVRDRERIIAKIEQFDEDPASLTNQVLTLTGGHYRRLRVGSYRVIFSVEQHGETTTMIVLRVRHRSNAYD